MSKKIPVYIIGTNHFDPVWRRGFKKPFYYDGKKYVGAAVVEDACLNEWFKLSEVSDSSIEVECSLCLRTYLNSHPEKIDVIKQLIVEKRFELLACGEVIPDTNMISGESLVRNLIYGILWARKTLGITPTIGNLNDAFGVSAQLPQIFKGCDVNSLTGLTYKFPMGDYWKGLDETLIQIIPNMQYPFLGMAKYVSGGTYYRPCEKCMGEGCEACENYGIDTSFRMGCEITLDGLDVDKNGFGVIYVGGEETLVSSEMPRFVKEANEKNDKYEYKWSTFSQVIENHFGDIIKETDNCDVSKIAPEIEGNPIQTGCYVTRIKTKQQVRRLENLVITYEKLAALCNLDFNNLFLELWRNISFAGFHDNVTGTHVDVGYEELCECYKTCDELLKAIHDGISVKNNTQITVFNPNSKTSGYINLVNNKGENSSYYIKDIDGNSCKVIDINEFKAVIFEDSKADFMENEFYKISFDKHGITQIYDKTNSKDLINERLGYANELVLENDFGDPWTTREEDRKRTRLGKMNDLESFKEWENGYELVYKGRFRGNEKLLDDPADYRVLLLEWKQIITLRKHENYIDFKTEILWDTFDRRIRISFPTYMSDDDGYYAIPYGTLKRKKYDKEARKGVGVADGDWPTMEWFSTAKRNDVNIALINQGIPSARIERGDMMMSVLRSPTFPSCLFWPRVYNAPVYDGMRDRGKHEFNYAFTSFNGEWNNSKVWDIARQFNSPLIVLEGEVKSRIQLPTLNSKSTLISAIKKSEEDDSLIIRIWEYKGIDDEIDLSVPITYKKVFETNLLEDNKAELEIVNGLVKINMQKFKIKTLKFTV